MTSERFSIISSQTIDQVISDNISKNTKKNNSWSTKVYEDWVHWRNSLELDKKKKFLHLIEFDPTKCLELERALKHFIFEAKRQDGNDYPPNTLYNIVCGINRYIRSAFPDINIMSDDLRFVYIRKCLDARMKELTQRGVGVIRKQAEPVSDEQEALLWEKSSFSMNDAVGLQRAVYFYVCKAFGLRAVDEHRNMQISQFEFGEDDQGKYVLFVGKNNKIYGGGISDRRISPKQIKQYETISNPISIYKIVQRYINCLQQNGIHNGPFYRRPLKSIHFNQPRYSVTPVGVNKLSKLLSEAAMSAGITANITAHSGKVTCATKLFNMDVDEQLIKQRTGHRSDAVRLYKRTSNGQQKRISEILEPPSPKKRILDSFIIPIHAESFVCNFDFDIKF